MLGRALALSYAELSDEDVEKLRDFQATYSEDAQRREQRTEGYGDRASGRTNTEPDKLERYFPNNSLTVTSVSSDAPLDDLSQQDIDNVRDAVFTYASETLNGEPTISEDNLRLAIDSFFGSGASDFFAVDLDNNGGGRSVLRVQSRSEQDLGTEERDIIRNAQANALINYEASTLSNALKGGDVDATISEIDKVLGPAGKFIVKELEDSLSKPGDVEAALSNVREQAEGLGLSGADTRRLEELLGNLSDLNSRVQASFNDNALFDEFSLEYSSGKYRESFDKNEIDSIMELTNPFED